MESQKRRYERAVKILRVIAEADASDPRNLPNKYDVFKALKDENLGTEPTFLAAIDDLEEAGIIEPSLIDTHARGGAPSKHYELTLMGLEDLLGAIYNLGWKGVGFRKGTKFGTLARRYSSLLPEILGFWEKYQQLNVVDIIQQALVSINASPPEEFEEGIKTLKRWKREWLAEDPTRRAEDYRKTMEEGWRKYLVERLFLHLDVLSPKEDAQRWHKALKQDRELVKPYLENLRRKRAEQQHYLEKLDAEIREFEST